MSSVSHELKSRHWEVFDAEMPGFRTAILGNFLDIASSRATYFLALIHKPTTPRTNQDTNPHTVSVLIICLFRGQANNANIVSSLTRVPSMYSRLTFLKAMSGVSATADVKERLLVVNKQGDC